MSTAAAGGPSHDPPGERSQTSEAVYQLDLKITFLGFRPCDHNRAAPEVTPACRAAVEAARRVLEDAGYTIAHVGHGSRRIDEGDYGGTVHSTGEARH